MRFEIDIADARAAQRPITIRRATRADSDAVAEMLGQLSSQTRYLRYYTARPLSGAAGSLEANRIVSALPPHAFTLLALAQVDGREEVVGVAELVRDQQVLGMGEAALLVRDDWQRRGVGSLLAAELIQLAHANAVQVVRCFTLPENRAIPRLVKRLGAPFRVATRPGEVCINIDVQAATSSAEPIPTRAGSATISAVQAGA